MGKSETILPMNLLHEYIEISKNDVKSEWMIRKSDFWRVFGRAFYP